MTSRDPHLEDGPELVPPAELLRLHAELARPPRPELRAQHLAATAMAARQRRNRPMGRFATRGARAAVAIVAALAVTSGLAGAQLLPDQAQRLLSNVSDRFAPTEDSDPPADPATPGDATTTLRSAPNDPAPDDDDGTPADATTTTTTTTTTSTPEPVESVADPATTSTTLPPVTVTTIPGPGGPGSPDDPTDPDATTTTVPPTTTTTQPPTTTTTWVA